MAKSKARRVKRATRTRRSKPARRVTARKPARRPAARGKAKAKVAKRAAPKRTARPAKRPVKRPAKPAAAGAPRVPAPKTLARERRRLPDAERLDSNRMDSKLVSSVRAGRNDLRHRLAEHTESDPSLTAGDVDAKWEDAYAVGDEAPGGDNPTPDQDRVDDIGHALGIEYQDAEELKSSDKITKRDQHRWELDPASSDDWPHTADEDE